MQIPTLPDFSGIATTIEIGKLLPNIMYVILCLIIGYPSSKLAGVLAANAAAKHMSPHHAMIIRRAVFYLVFLMFFILILWILGLDPKALLGAGGIVAAALAFASTTGMSNMISGFFLIFEKPFIVGDYIVVSEMTGEILSIDLLSINIRTRDNTLVRIPNELLLKSQFQNLSRFPIRRIDLIFRFWFHEDLQHIKTILLSSAERNPLCLQSPPPEFYVLEFGESGINVQFSVWAKLESYADLKTNMQIDIQKAFKKHNIEIPFYYQHLPSQNMEKPTFK